MLNLLVGGTAPKPPLNSPVPGLAARSFGTLFAVPAARQDEENGQRCSSCLVASASFSCSSWPSRRSTLALTVSSSRISSRAFR